MTPDDTTPETLIARGLHEFVANGDAKRQAIAVALASIEARIDLDEVLARMGELEPSKFGGPDHG